MSETFTPDRVRRQVMSNQEADAAARFLELIGGKGCSFVQNTDDAPATFEVRRDGWHVGFVNVLDSGEVVWL